MTFIFFFHKVKYDLTSSILIHGDCEPFHAMVVVGLGSDFSFKYTLARYGLLFRANKNYNVFIFTFQDLA